MTAEELMDLDDLKDYLERIYEQVLQINETRFEDLDELFDKLAEDANKARRLCDSLIPRNAA